MYDRNLVAAGLLTLYLSSAACAPATVRNPAIDPRTARINLQKRIDEFTSNRGLINVYMATG